MTKSSAPFEISNLFNVKDRVALVTGGGTPRTSCSSSRLSIDINLGSGIGLMCVQALAANGAKVYITGRTQEKLETVVRTYGPEVSGQIIPLTADITSKSEIERLVKEVESKEKCLCVLINNAGIASSQQAPEGEKGEALKESLFKPENANFDDWAGQYLTNTTAIYMLTTAFLPLLEKATEHNPGYSGTVINITSISGSVLKSQSHFAYNVSKAASNHLTKLLAAEVANHGLKLRINAIAPGVYPSEMTAKSSGDDQKSELPQEKYAHLPARRPGKDEDMANAILFAVTNQYLNGQIIAVDGGYLLKFGYA